MKFGITNSQFELLLDLVVNPLKKRGAKVFIFGSRVSNKFHPYSDVDLLYSFSHDEDLPSGFLSDSLTASNFLILPIRHI